MKILFLKTRTNFFPKYNKKEQSLILHKNETVQKAIVDESDYRLLLEILAYFQQGNYLHLSDKDRQYKKLLKFAIVNDLIHPPYEERELSNFLLDYLENAYDDYKPLVEKLKRTKWELLSMPETIQLFFKKHGLISSSNVKRKTQRILWLDEHSNLQPTKGDLCVIHQAGNYVLFFYTKEVDYFLAQSIVGEIDDQNKTISISDEILSMHLIIKYVDYLQKKTKLNIITKVTSYGHVDRMNKQKITDTYEQYPRTFPTVYDDNNLEFIQAIESKLKDFQGTSFTINEGSGIYSNQLNIAQYEIKVNNNFTYTAFDYTYRRAAEYCLTRIIEKFLQQKTEITEHWVSERSKERFYIRGMASFLEKNNQYFRLRNLPRSIKKKIKYITTLSTQITNLHIVIQYIYHSYIFQIYLLDQDQRILYTSDLSHELLEEIDRGLAFVTASVINRVEIKKGTMNNHLTSLDFPEIEISDQHLYEKLLSDTRHLQIEERAWVFQPYFEPHGLFIGKFTRKGWE